jgi:23S rRNA (cytosine1962-C5)-methyltransferase
VKREHTSTSERRPPARHESGKAFQQAGSETGAPRATRLRLRITAAAENFVRGGHPWIFADSVRESNRAGTAGELAIIFDRKDKFLAVGLFDPDSPIRVRVLHTGKPVTIDTAWWSAHLACAVERRQNLFNEQTTGYRIINGESDGWPGLVLDRYATTLVLKIYTAAWLPRLEEITQLLCVQLSPERIVLRLSRNIGEAAAQFKHRDGEIIFGSEPTGPVVFLETGLRFEADVLRGQKTGFFLDQRENRRLVESLARGRNALNAFSFSGGFSLYAARGGAKSVTDLDISPHALAGAERNFLLNKSDARIADCPHESAQGDTFAWLGENAARKFDLIILDPPSFAKREAERTNAIRAYERLSSLGIEHLNAGGILVSCSCSAHVSSEEFFEAVRSAASRSGRNFSELQTTKHAPDHAASFKEAEYLKAIYLKLA